MSQWRELTMLVAVVELYDAITRLIIRVLRVLCGGMPPPARASLWLARSFKIESE